MPRGRPTFFMAARERESRVRSTHMRAGARRRLVLGDASEADMAVDEVAEAATHMHRRARAIGEVADEHLEHVHIEVTIEVGTQFGNDNDPRPVQRGQRSRGVLRNTLGRPGYEQRFLARKALRQRAGKRRMHG